MESSRHHQYYILCKPYKRCPSWRPSWFTGLQKNNHDLRNVSADDNLCFFRCLAVHRGADPHWCEQPAKNLFYNYCTRFDVAPEHFAGVQLFDFLHLEDFFELNLIAYELDGKVAKLVQRSREFYKETIERLRKSSKCDCRFLTILRCVPMRTLW